MIGKIQTRVKISAGGERMFDDLKAYFYEDVVASYEECRDVKRLQKTGRSRLIRKAVVAASALYHFREHLENGLHDQHDFSREKISQICPDYDLLGNIVNCSKHATINRNSPLVDKAENMAEYNVITFYKDEKGEYQNIENEVHVKLNDGSTREMFEILTNVINFWFRHLRLIGVIDIEHQYPLPDRKQPKMRNECTGTRRDIEIISGVRFQQNLLLKKYNYETGKVEPVDLTGCQIRGEIHGPTTAFELVIANNTTGETFKKEIALSDEEIQQYAMVSSDEEKKSFQQTMCNNHKDEIQDALREHRII